MKEWIMHRPITKLEINLTNAFLNKAQYFDLPLYEKTVFSSYEQLLSFLDYNIKASWEYLVNNICWEYRKQLKELIVRFYNMLAHIFPKNNVNNILKKITVKQLKRAWGSAGPFGRDILLDSNTLYCSYNNSVSYEWADGFKTSNSIFKTLFHELGHIINYQYISEKIDIITHLKKFLTQKINNAQNLDQEKIFQIFHFSNYSFTNLSEFFAESFAYWFLANPVLKTRAWEFWYEFLILYLPKVMQSI